MTGTVELSEKRRALLDRLLAAEGLAAAPAERIPPRPPGPAPLSFGQQRLWFLQELDPASVAYNLSEGVRLRGTLDRGALARALAALVERHEALRTAFPSVQGEPVQEVLSARAVPLPAADLSALPPAAREAEAARLASLLAHRPFDLSRGPLLAAALLPLAPEDHVLVLVLHHIVSDGWSMGILVRELAACYAAFAAGAVPELAPLPIQYADFAVWQREKLAGDALAAQLAYWRERLAGAPALLDLPTDRPRPPVVRSAGARVDLTLDAEATARLAALARRQGATLFMALAAALAALLHRWTRQTDLLLGTPSAGRGRPETEGLIGFFVNTLVLRLDAAGDPGFLTLLARTRETVLGADAHQDLPFERLIDALDLPRDLSRSPLFQVMLAFQSLPPAAAPPHGLQLTTFGFATRSAQTDLHPSLLETPAGLAGSVEYRTDLFDAATVHRFVAHFAATVRAAVADPGLPIAALPLLAPAERQQALAEWNDTAEPLTSGEPLLHELIAARAAQTPQAVAAVYEDGALTYAELEERAGSLARRLLQLGCGPESLVGVALYRSLDLVVALYAALKAGAAYCPLDPDYPAERLAYMLADSRPAVLLTHRPLLAALPAWDGPTLCLDEPAADAGQPGLPAAAGDLSLAYTLYTSGSTGRPKGAMVHHRAIVNRLLWMQRAYRLEPSDVVLQKTPFSFDVSVWEFFWPLLAGARLVLARPGGHKDPAYLAALIAAERVTVLHFVPAMLQAFLEEPTVSGLCRGLCRVVASGEALPPELVRRFTERLPGVALENLYGPTEAAVDVTAWPAAAADSRTVPIGRPIANTRIHLLDAHLAPVPVGVAGELWIGGVNVGRGYLHRPELTAERFVADPYSATPGARMYRTGDLARHRPDGAIEFLGRIDHQVKLRGFRIELGEIETTLASHPAVREAAVAVDDTGAVRRLVGWVVPQPGAGFDAQALRAYLAERLPEHMVPAFLIALDRLPLSPNGKLDRSALPKPDAAALAPAAAWVPPDSPAEEALAAVWSAVLRRDRIGAEDNFFALGGDSILSVQVLARARELGFGLTLEQLFQHQTVRALARAATQGLAASPPAAPFSLLREDDLARLPQGLADAYPLTRLQAGMLFHSELDPEAALYHDIFSGHLEAPYDEACLRRAVAFVTGAHPVLRTSFDLTSFSEPLQLVHQGVEPEMAVEDLRRLDPAAQEAAVAAWMKAESERPIDWQKAPLFRVAVHRRGERTFQLALSFHHAILDGWSVATLSSELLAVYTSLVKGAEPPSPVPVNALRSYVALEQEALRNPASRAFWEGELSGVTVSTLPRRGEARGGEPGRGLVEGLLPAELSAALDAISRRSGLPVKSLLLAVHCRVLSLLAAQAEVVTGIVSSGRPEESGAERALGLFLNTLPLRVEVAGATWMDLARRAFDAELRLLPHRRYPMVELQRGGAGRVLYEAVFNFVHFHVYQDLAEVGEVRSLGDEYFEQTNFTFLANFSRHPASGRLYLRLEHDASELARAQVAAWAGLYERALAAFVRAPEALAEQVSLLSAAERQQVLEWNDTAEDLAAGGALLHQLVAAQAARTPDAVAAADEAGTLSYSELEARAGRLAGALRLAGCGPDALVGVCLHRSTGLVVALYAALKAGAAYLPLDPDYPAERLAAMLEDARPAAVVTDRALSSMLPPRDGPTLLLDEGSAGGGTAAPSMPDSALAYAIYTSGSTGRPKGALVHHRAIVNRLLWMQRAYRLGPADTVLQKTPFSFDVSVWEFFWPLITGARQVLARPGGHKDPAYLARLIADEKVTVLHFVPSMLQAFVEEPTVPQLCRGLRLAVASGEALAADLARRFSERLPGVELANLYGPTEAAVDVTSWRATAEPAHAVPIGRPIANTTIHLLDRNLLPVPPGVSGELWIGGTNVGRGYLQRPELTAERFLPDPMAAEPGTRMYRTGDLARHRSDGAIEYLGRVDHQVKIRGFRIELGEVEAALTAHPAVREAAAAVDEVPGSRRLVAYVVPQGEGVLDEDALRRFLAGRLPDFMVPALFVALERLPLSPNGKLDRRALPKPERERPERTEYVAPASEVEARLAALWAEVLGVPEVGVEDDFFGLGGDSILSLQVSARARQRGLELTSRMLFENPTIAALARVVGTAPRPRAEQGPVRGEAPLLPIAHWLLEQDLPAPHHFNQAVLLAVRGALAPPALEGAVAALGRHHDALRLRLAETGGGAPVLRFADESAGPRLATVDLSALPSARRRAALELAADGLQASLDLAAGPLCRVVWLMHGPEESRLLFVVHHLAVDGVSWRILLEDLETAYRQLAAGGAASLPEKTTSLKEWAERLAAQGRDGARSAELAFWTAPERAAVGPLALPRAGRGGGRALTASSLAVDLPAEATAALLAEVPRAYNTQINDALLAALAWSYREETGEPALLVDLEGHGREEIAPDLDVSRTVGWLTTLFPVLLDLRAAAGPGAALIAVKEQLRAIPERGLGYGVLRHLAGPEAGGRLAALPRAELLFNYLGQVDQTLPRDSAFTLAPEASGASRDPRGARSHALEVNALVAGGALHCEWIWSPEVHAEADVERWARAFLAALTTLIDHCRSPEAGGYTPSDFPDVALSQSQLDDVLAEIAGGDDAA